MIKLLGPWTTYKIYYQLQQVQSVICSTCQACCPQCLPRVHTNAADFYASITTRTSGAVQVYGRRREACLLIYAHEQPVVQAVDVTAGGGVIHGTPNDTARGSNGLLRRTDKACHETCTNLHNCHPLA